MQQCRGSVKSTERIWTKWWKKEKETTEHLQGIGVGCYLVTVKIMWKDDKAGKTDWRWANHERPKCQAMALNVFVTRERHIRVSLRSNLFSVWESRRESNTGYREGRNSASRMRSLPLSRSCRSPCSKAKPLTQPHLPTFLMTCSHSLMALKVSHTFFSTWKPTTKARDFKGCCGSIVLDLRASHLLHCTLQSFFPSHKTQSISENILLQLLLPQLLIYATEPFTTEFHKQITTLIFQAPPV